MTSQNRPSSRHYVREAEATRYLKRALKARSRDITQGGREDARNMLSKVQKRKRGNR